MLDSDYVEVSDQSAVTGAQVPIPDPPVVQPLVPDQPVVAGPGCTNSHAAVNVVYALLFVSVAVGYVLLENRAGNVIKARAGMTQCTAEIPDAHIAEVEEDTLLPDEHAHEITQDDEHARSELETAFNTVSESTLELSKYEVDEQIEKNRQATNQLNQVLDAWLDAEHERVKASEEAKLQTLAVDWMIAHALPNVTTVYVVDNTGVYRRTATSGSLFKVVMAIAVFIILLQCFCLLSVCKENTRLT